MSYKGSVRSPSSPKRHQCNPINPISTPLLTDAMKIANHHHSFSSFSSQPHNTATTTTIRNHSASTSGSSNVEDPLSPGDLVGENLPLQGSPASLVSESLDDPNPPAKQFEVIKRLGTGSYAIVYLVREVLSRPDKLRGCSEDGHMSLMGSMDMESPRSSLDVKYGREFAIKCLSKANLDEDALACQMTEVHIHQSLRPHPNIVTLHRTLETPSFLLLILEYVPGEDLFYFLEQSRDHASDELPSTPSSSATPLSPDSCTANSPTSDSSTNSTNSRGTPPTPSLLSSTQPSQLLTPTRLRLIASMFTQMCDAVAACHKQSVYHRDIKPENFIVTDGWTQTLVNGRMRKERKVVVKLTDFGLSTTDTDSGDMDCGSAPYMAYECRNNVSPTYTPRDADVWSLGIVLINMLYHYNPWTDTAINPPVPFHTVTARCSSFEAYRKQGAVTFFTSRFMGMTREVAEALGKGVFCILGEPGGPTKRWEAADLGKWARDLPTLLGTPSRGAEATTPLPRSASISSPVSPLSAFAAVSSLTTPLSAIQHSPHLGHTRGLSISSIGTGHPIANCEASHRPSSRQASAAPGHRNSIIPGGSPLISASRSLSRVSSGLGAMQRGMSRERRPSMIGAGAIGFEVESTEEAGGHGLHELSTVYDEEVEPSNEGEPDDMSQDAASTTRNACDFLELHEADFPEDDYGDEIQENEIGESESATHSRSTSTNAGKRRKRGARKGKNASVSLVHTTVCPTPAAAIAASAGLPSPPHSADPALPAWTSSLVPSAPATPTVSTDVLSSWSLKGKLSSKSLKSPDDTLKTLASASQTLAREISKATKAPTSPTSPTGPIYPAQLVMKQTLSGKSSSKRSVQSSKSQQSTGASSGKSSRQTPMHSSASSISNPANLNSQGRRSNARTVPFEPVSMYGVPAALMSPPPVPKPLPIKESKESGAQTGSATSPVEKAPHQLGVPKKTSKWKLSFGKSSGGRISPVEELPSPVPPTPSSSSFGLGSHSSSSGDTVPAAAMSATATNVTNLLNGLTPSHHQFLNHPPPSPTRTRGLSPLASATMRSVENLSSSASPEGRMADDRSRSRGRRSSPGRVYGQSPASSISAGDRSRTRGRSGFAFANGPMGGMGGQPNPLIIPQSPERHSPIQYRNGNHSTNSLASSSREVYQTPQQRAHSPSVYTHRSTPAPSISSIASSKANWRSSMMSTSTASSAFTRYSNASMRSVDTVATSVSASSWRTGASNNTKPVPGSPGSPGFEDVPPVPTLPANVKYMTGVPFILGQAKTNSIPPDPTSIDNGPNSYPPPRKQRSKKQSKDSNKLLDTITESSQNAATLRGFKSDASTSTTDLSNGGAGKEDGIKKVQRGQITALGKMLSAFKQKS